jgi:hypothetical protein
VSTYVITAGRVRVVGSKRDFLNWDFVPLGLWTYGMCLVSYGSLVLGSILIGHIFFALPGLDTKEVLPALGGDWNNSLSPQGGKFIHVKIAMLIILLVRLLILHCCTMVHSGLPIKHPSDN